eukprot:2021283-Amphidinium_carterae.1
MLPFIISRMTMFCVRVWGGFVVRALCPSSHVVASRSAASPILASAPASLARSQRRARRLSHGRSHW